MLLVHVSPLSAWVSWVRNPLVDGLLAVILWPQPELNQHRHSCGWADREILVGARQKKPRSRMGLLHHLPVLLPNPRKRHWCTGLPGTTFIESKSEKFQTWDVLLKHLRSLVFTAQNDDLHCYAAEELPVLNPLLVILLPVSKQPQTYQSARASWMISETLIFEVQH